MGLGSFATRDLHVGASDRACIKHVLRKLNKEAHSRANRKDRHDLLRDALKAHHDHQGLVNTFRL